MSNSLLSVLRAAINSAEGKRVVYEIEQLRSDALIVQHFISQHIRLADFGSMNKNSELGALYRLFSFLDKMTRN